MVDFCSNWTSENLTILAAILFSNGLKQNGGYNGHLCIVV
jgi:hypothetical protein